MGGGLPANELQRVKAWINEVQNGSSTQKARFADGARRRPTPTDPRVARREKRADAWCRWFHARMKEAGSSDPVEHLPDALALIEERIDARIAAELVPARKKIAKLERAAAGNSIVAWKLDRAYYRITPFLSNGQMGPPCDVRPLFEQFYSEVGGES